LVVVGSSLSVGEVYNVNKRIIRIGVILVVMSTLTALAAPQIKQIIKIAGVGAAVKQFGPDINKAINGLTGRKDTPSSFTKTVPIITIGLNTRGAIGAAQVMGAKKNVEKVQAVAQVEGNLLGEIKVRALVPVDSIDITKAKDIKPVDGVGVSGIVDLRL
jgi:hypothetical protein